MSKATRRLYIRLPGEEFELLRMLAQREMRDTRSHLRWLILQEAARRGIRRNDYDVQEATDDRREAA